MQGNRTSGQASKFTVSILAEDGTPYVPTGAAWEIFDEAGVAIDDDAIDVSSAADSVSFTVPAAALTLPEGVTSAGRELVVTLTTADGAIELRDYFVLVASNPLVRLTNTIVTYAEALAIRQGFGPSLNAWDATEDHAARASALIHAHANLCRIGYTVSMLNGGQVSDYAGYGTGTDDIFDMSKRVRLTGITADAFAALPDHFQRAIKRAQLIEADSILGGDEVGDKRADGIISETIGESSTFFQSKPGLNLPISRRTFAALKGYIAFSVSAGR